MIDCLGHERCNGKAVRRLQKIGRSLADDHAGRHGVAGGDPWKNGRVSDAQAIDAVHPQLAIDDGKRVSPHLGRAALMPITDSPVAHEVFQRNRTVKSRDKINFMAPFQSECAGVSNGLKTSVWKAGRIHAMQALLNFSTGILTARMNRVVSAHGLDPCFGFLHNGRKPGRLSLVWDCVELDHKRVGP
jgi:hypothetical protein